MCFACLPLYNSHILSLLYFQEKEGVKKQLQEAQAELARRAGDVSLKDTLAEKNEQIAGLLQEGMGAGNLSLVKCLAGSLHSFSIHKDKDSTCHSLKCVVTFQVHILSCP
jgi:hypothetical protein